MFEKVAVSIKLGVTEDDRNTVALPLQQRKKLFLIRCLLEVPFCIFAWPSLHKTHFESKSVALYVEEESDFFNFALPLADIGALYVTKMTISTLLNNYKEFFFYSTYCPIATLLSLFFVD